MDIIKTVARSLIEAAKTAARISLVLPGALLLSLAGPSPVRAARLNVNIAVQGMTRIINLTAAPSATPGAIDLTWTEPRFLGVTDPRSYELRVSTLGQISNDADFAAARPISDFSPISVPLPGPGGGQVAIAVTELDAGKVYYFALREQDSGGHVGAWVRNPARGWNTNNFAAASTGGAPVPVTDLAAQPGTFEGDIALSWSAPATPGGAPLSYYDLRYATFSVADLGAGAEAWFGAAAGRVLMATATSAGSPEIRLLSGLRPSATFYFGLKSIDRNGNASAVDSRAAAAQASALPRNLAPAVPQGLALAAGLNRARASWLELSAAGRGLDFAYYRVQRSTHSDRDFVTVSTVPAGGYLDRFLTPFVTYYFRISARDEAGLESAFTPAVAVLPFNLPPMAPLGLKATPTVDGSSVTFDWAATRRWEDGTEFDSAGVPTGDELQGYRIMRSTYACAPGYSFLSSAAVQGSSFTDHVDGEIYYYKMMSYNSRGASTDTFVISSLGEQYYFLGDCISRLSISAAQTADLRKESNGLGADIRIAPRQRSEDIGGQVFQSVEFRALREGAFEEAGFHFSQPGRVVLHYNAVAGVPVPQASALGAGAGSAAPAAASAKNLGVYWDNGSEFKKLYGRVDPAGQTVTVETPNVGVFQIRSLYRADGAVFDLSNMSSRVITPNGDGLNDVLIFTYDPGPDDVQPTGRVFDMQGRMVADMTPGLVPNTLTWDGRMRGTAVTGGVYVYEIKGGGKTFNGTVVVTR